MEVSVDTPWQSTVARYLSSAGKLNHSSRPHLWTQTQLTKTNLLRVFSRNDKPKYQFGWCGHLPTLWYNLQVLGLLLTAISQYKTIATLFGGTINVKSWYIQLSEAALAQASAEIPDAEIGFQNLSERRLWSDQGVSSGRHRGRIVVDPERLFCVSINFSSGVMSLMDCFYISVSLRIRWCWLTVFYLCGGFIFPDCSTVSLLLIGKSAAGSWSRHQRFRRVWDWLGFVTLSNTFISNSMLEEDQLVKAPAGFLIQVQEYEPCTIRRPGARFLSLLLVYLLANSGIRTVTWKASDWHTKSWKGQLHSANLIQSIGYWRGK